MLSANVRLFVSACIGHIIAGLDYWQDHQQIEGPRAQHGRAKASAAAPRLKMTLTLGLHLSTMCVQDCHDIPSSGPACSAQKPLLCRAPGVEE